MTEPSTDPEFPIRKALGELAEEIYQGGPVYEPLTGPEFRMQEILVGLMKEFDQLRAAGQGGAFATGVQQHLRGILDDPGNDARLLVLADWLEEQGLPSTASYVRQLVPWPWPAGPPAQIFNLFAYAGIRAPAQGPGPIAWSGPGPACTPTRS